MTENKKYIIISRKHWSEEEISEINKNLNDGVFIFGD